MKYIIISLSVIILALTGGQALPVSQDLKFETPEGKAEILKDIRTKKHDILSPIGTYHHQSPIQLQLSTEQQSHPFRRFFPSHNSQSVPFFSPVEIVQIPRSEDEYLQSVKIPRPKLVEIHSLTSTIPLSSLDPLRPTQVIFQRVPVIIEIIDKSKTSELSNTPVVSTPKLSPLEEQSISLNYENKSLNFEKQQINLDEKPMESHSTQKPKESPNSILPEEQQIIYTKQLINENSIAVKDSAAHGNDKLNDETKDNRDHVTLLPVTLSPVSTLTINEDEINPKMFENQSNNANSATDLFINVDAGTTSEAIQDIYDGANESNMQTNHQEMHSKTSVLSDNVHVNEEGSTNEATLEEIIDRILFEFKNLPAVLDQNIEKEKTEPILEKKSTSGTNTDIQFTTDNLAFTSGLLHGGGIGKSNEYLKSETEPAGSGNFGMKLFDNENIKEKTPKLTESEKNINSEKNNQPKKIIGSPADISPAITRSANSIAKNIFNSSPTERTKLRTKINGDDILTSSEIFALLDQEIDKSLSQHGFSDATVLEVPKQSEINPLMSLDNQSNQDESHQTHSNLRIRPLAEIPTEQHTLENYILNDTSLINTIANTDDQIFGGKSFDSHSKSSGLNESDKSPVTLPEEQLSQGKFIEENVMLESKKQHLVSSVLEAKFDGKTSSIKADTTNQGMPDDFAISHDMSDFKKIETKEKSKGKLDEEFASLITEIVSVAVREFLANKKVIAIPNQFHNNPHQDDLFLLDEIKQQNMVTKEALSADTDFVLLLDNRNKGNELQMKDHQNTSIEKYKTSNETALDILIPEEQEARVSDAANETMAEEQTNFNWKDINESLAAITRSLNQINLDFLVSRSLNSTKSEIVNEKIPSSEGNAFLKQELNISETPTMPQLSESENDDIKRVESEGPIQSTFDSSSLNNVQSEISLSSIKDKPIGAGSQLTKPNIAANVGFHLNNSALNEESFSSNPEHTQKIESVTNSRKSLESHLLTNVNNKVSDLKFQRDEYTLSFSDDDTLNLDFTDTRKAQFIEYDEVTEIIPPEVYTERAVSENGNSNLKYTTKTEAHLLESDFVNLEINNKSLTLEPTVETNARFPSSLQIGINESRSLKLGKLEKTENQLHATVLKNENVVHLPNLYQEGTSTTESTQITETTSEGNAMFETTEPILNTVSQISGSLIESSIQADDTTSHQAVTSNKHEKLQISHLTADMLKEAERPTNHTTPEESDSTTSDYMLSTETESEMNAILETTESILILESPDLESMIDFLEPIVDAGSWQINNSDNEKSEIETTNSSLAEGMIRKSDLITVESESFTESSMDKIALNVSDQIKLNDNGNIWVSLEQNKHDLLTKEEQILNHTFPAPRSELPSTINKEKELKIDEEGPSEHKNKEAVSRSHSVTDQPQIKTEETNQDIHIKIEEPSLTDDHQRKHSTLLISEIAEKTNDEGVTIRKHVGNFNAVKPIEKNFVAETETELDKQATFGKKFNESLSTIISSNKIAEANLTSDFDELDLSLFFFNTNLHSEKYLRENSSLMGEAPTEYAIANISSVVENNNNIGHSSSKNYISTKNVSSNDNILERGKIAEENIKTADNLPDGEHILDDTFLDDTHLDDTTYRPEKDTQNNVSSNDNAIIDVTDSITAKSVPDMDKAELNYEVVKEEAMAAAVDSLAAATDSKDAAEFIQLNSESKALIEEKFTASKGAVSHILNFSDEYDKQNKTANLTVPDELNSVTQVESIIQITGLNSNNDIHSAVVQSADEEVPVLANNFTISETANLKDTSKNTDNDSTKFNNIVNINAGTLHSDTQSELEDYINSKIDNTELKVPDVYTVIDVLTTERAFPTEIIGEPSFDSKNHSDSNVFVSILESKTVNNPNLENVVSQLPNGINILSILNESDMLNVKQEPLIESAKKSELKNENASKNSQAINDTNSTILTFIDSFTVPSNSQELSATSPDHTKTQDPVNKELNFDLTYNLSKNTGPFHSDKTIFPIEVAPQQSTDKEQDSILKFIESLTVPSDKQETTDAISESFENQTTMVETEDQHQLPLDNEGRQDNEILLHNLPITTANNGGNERVEVTVVSSRKSVSMLDPLLITKRPNLFRRPMVKHAATNIVSTDRASNFVNTNKEVHNNLEGRSEQRSIGPSGRKIKEPKDSEVKLSSRISRGRSIIDRLLGDLRIVKKNPSTSNNENSTVNQMIKVFEDSSKLEEDQVEGFIQNLKKITKTFLKQKTDTELPMPKFIRDITAMTEHNTVEKNDKIASVILDQNSNLKDVTTDNSDKNPRTNTSLESNLPIMDKSEKDNETSEMIHKRKQLLELPKEIKVQQLPLSELFGAHFIDGHEGQSNAPAFHEVHLNTIQSNAVLLNNDTQLSNASNEGHNVIRIEEVDLPNKDTLVEQINEPIKPSLLLSIYHSKSGRSLMPVSMQNDDEFKPMENITHHISSTHLRRKNV